MAGLNRLMISGTIGSDAIVFERENSGNGFKCMMHIDADPIGARRLWISVYWQGRKAEAGIDKAVKGARVVIDGKLGPNDYVNSQSVIINASNVFFVESVDEISLAGG